MNASIAQSKYFKNSVDHVFNKLDKDKSGTINRHELTVAMCHLHYKLAKHSPGLTEPPTEDTVTETLAKYDIDASGSLSKPEFVDFANKWFQDNGNAFFRRLVISSLISMVVLPGAASILHANAPLAKKVPKVIFKVLFGVVFKLVATNIPAKSDS